MNYRVCIFVIDYFFDMSGLAKNVILIRNHQIFLNAMTIHLSRKRAWYIHAEHLYKCDLVVLWIKFLEKMRFTSLLAIQVLVKGQQVTGSDALERCITDTCLDTSQTSNSDLMDCFKSCKDFTEKYPRLETITTGPLEPTSSGTTKVTFYHNGFRVTIRFPIWKQQSINQQSLAVLPKIVQQSKRIRLLRWQIQKRLHIPHLLLLLRNPISCRHCWYSLSSSP